MLVMLDKPEEVMVQYVKVYIDENNKTYLNGATLDFLDDSEDKNYEILSYYKVNENVINQFINKKNEEDKTLELRKEYFSVTQEELKYGIDAYREITEGQLYEYYKSSGCTDAEALLSTGMYFGKDNIMSLDKFEHTR